MSTRKKKTPFPTWQSMEPGGVEKKYIRLGMSQLMAPSCQDLTPGAFRLYVYMLFEAGGKKEFELSQQKYKSIMTEKTFRRARSELVEKGFINYTSNQNLRKINKYWFVESWKDN